MKTSRIPRNLNVLGETAFLGGIFCLEYPSRRSESVNGHFLNYRLSFHKLQIFISQTTDFHFVSFHFVSFRFISFRFAPFHFANYSKPEIISKKFASGVSAIKCIRYFLPFEILLNVYNILVQPHFDYCDVLSMGKLF